MLKILVVESIVCECGLSFSGEKSLRKHLEIHSNVKCSLCQKVFIDKTAYVNHKNQYHPGVEVFGIREQPTLRFFKQPPIPKKDVLRVVPNTQLSELVVFSDIKEEVMNEETITTEVQVSPQPEKKQRKSKIIPKRRVCEVCGKKYASNAALTYHQRVHTGEKPYACPECPKRFALPTLLQIHFRTHTGERPYQCHLCSKSFSNKAAINRHSLVHTGVKPYACSECGKCFTQSNSVKLHIRTVHMKLPAPYKKKPKLHTRAATAHDTVVPESRRFECSECGKRLSHRSALERHVFNAHLRHDPPSASPPSVSPPSASPPSASPPSANQTVKIEPDVYPDSPDEMYDIYSTV